MFDWLTKMDNSCGARFHLMDAFDNLQVRCTLDVHDGPHVDDINGYTWGVLSGEDGYTKKRREMIQAVENRRKTSAMNITRKKRGA
jgi:hypothetical protein